MKKVKEKMDMELKKRIPLVMALANLVMKKLNFVEIVNENAAEWDEAHWLISPGALMKALIFATFVDVRVTLTGLQERLTGIDLEYLIGPEAVGHDINAFNVGRALERIGDGKCDRAYEMLALSALQEYNIPCERAHGDTTSVSFYGEYDVAKMKISEAERAELLEIERGYNKDGRPECKQIVVGQIVNEYGIPIASKAMNGSTSDVEWNEKALDYLEQLNKEGFKTGIFVADSKLVTHKLVSRMNSKESRTPFVSRCPANFEKKLEGRMIERAYKDDCWVDYGKVGGAANASSYRGISYQKEICGETMRLLVLESSALQTSAASSFEREEKKLESLKKAFEKQEFSCISDAERAFGQFKGSKTMKLFEPTMEIVETKTEKWPSGRRNNATKPTIVSTFSVHITHIEHNEQACREYIQNKSCIVLISNVVDDSKTDRNLLEIYKGQHIVENSFRQLKSPCLASVIYLKNPIRIKALQMVLSFALLIRAIIQFQLREGLKEHNTKHPNVPIYAGWARKKLTNPTFNLLFEHSYNCNFVRESNSEYSFTWCDVETKNNVKPLLQLMGESVTTILQ